MSLIGCCSICRIFRVTDWWGGEIVLLYLLSSSWVKKVMINQLDSCRLRYFKIAESELIVKTRKFGCKDV